jgi:hypothetical protein
MTKRPQQLELALTARILRFPRRIVIEILRDLGVDGSWLTPAYRGDHSGGAETT